MDLPLIAQLDLPIDAAGSYTMAIAIDGEPTINVGVHVRTTVQMTPNGMLS
jgi:hypothetical protein